MSASGKRHMQKVAGLPCVLGSAGFSESCSGRVHVHHVREGQGASQRAQDTLTVPLCEEHHTGSNGIHGLGRKGFYSRYKLDELDLLAMTLEELS